MPRGGGFTERNPAEQAAYPTVILRDSAAQITVDLGDVQPAEPIELFAEPLRICVDDTLKGRRVGIQYTLNAGNLRAPAKGKLRLLF